MSPDRRNEGKTGDDPDFRRFRAREMQIEGGAGFRHRIQFNIY